VGQKDIPEVGHFLSSRFGFWGIGSKAGTVANMKRIRVTSKIATAAYPCRIELDYEEQKRTNAWVGTFTNFEDCPGDMERHYNTLGEHWTEVKIPEGYWTEPLSRDDLAVSSKLWLQ
jgi:hypothetical protein